jgi:hypothetical protein
MSVSEGISITTLLQAIVVLQCFIISHFVAPPAAVTVRVELLTPRAMPILPCYPLLVTLW